MIKSKRKLIILIALLTVAMALFFGAFIFLKGSSYRYGLLQNPFIQHFTHSYHSVRKLPDLLFIPYLFIDFKIPTYNLRISVDNIIMMNAALSNDPFAGKLEEENKLFINAWLASEDDYYEDRVEVKYRGINANHWNSLKKSLRVKFPDGNFLNGKRLINLITPYDRAYFIEPLNAFRARKLGLIDVDFSYVRVDLNGRDAGVYLAFEHFSPEWLAKKGLPEETLYGIADGNIERAADITQYVNMFNKEGDTDKEPMQAFLELIHKSSDEEFRSLAPILLDIEKFLAWNVLNIISRSFHQDEAGNTILYFNTVTGKFEMIPWDTNIGDETITPYEDNFSVLMSRILSISEYKEKRDKILSSYLTDENLEEDLAFYDDLSKELKADFINDNYKLYNNFQYLLDVSHQRDLVIDNWNRAKDFIDSEINYSFTSEGEAVFSGSFFKFSEVDDSINEFLARAPQFFKLGIDTVGISGVHAISDDIVIPKGLTVEFFPGTNLFLGSEVSIISYSPVYVRGTAGTPVRISRAQGSKEWGSLLIVNAPATSTVNFLVADGGSGAYINGILATGMIAFHNSDVEIADSVFRNAEDDDALNVKSSGGFIENSLFEGNSSDGIDIDYPEDFVVRNNTFNSHGGDAIDLSFSDIVVSGNTISDCGDKGISVGERSNPNITDNTIKGCDIGIAVKDQSIAAIEANEITNNRIGISVYKKKSEFGGAIANLLENLLKGNQIDTETDDLSSIVLN